MFGSDYILHPALRTSSRRNRASIIFIIFNNFAVGREGWNFKIGAPTSCLEGVGQLLRVPIAWGESGMLQQQVRREVGYSADVSTSAGLQDALLRGHNVTLGHVPPRGACGRLVPHGAAVT